MHLLFRFLDSAKIVGSGTKRRQDRRSSSQGDSAQHRGKKSCFNFPAQRRIECLHQDLSWRRENSLAWRSGPDFHAVSSSCIVGFRRTEFAVGGQLYNKALDIILPWESREAVLPRELDLLDLGVCGWAVHC